MSLSFSHTVPLVAVVNFEPLKQQQPATSSETSPDSPSECLTTTVGQSLWALAYDPRTRIGSGPAGAYLATNCPQLPFASVASTGWIPAWTVRRTENSDPVLRSIAAPLQRVSHRNTTTTATEGKPTREVPSIRTTDVRAPSVVKFHPKVATDDASSNAVPAAAVSRTRRRWQHPQDVVAPAGYTVGSASVPRPTIAASVVAHRHAELRAPTSEPPMMIREKQVPSASSVPAVRSEPKRIAPARPKSWALFDMLMGDSWR
ncbi:hypothetical protein BJ742DRAFT_791908 [Cladochytrium replicatum]|nr:hypothetical protein BJ742DRAFT_791908 [Cladochytrium replicatum]